MAPVARGGDDLVGEFRRLHGELEGLFADMIGGPRAAGAPTVRAPADVWLTSDPPAITVQLDIAGVDPDAVDIELEADLLVIRGVRPRPRGERRVYQHAEIDWGRFERRLRLGVPVDAAGASASYDRGMLRITLPLAPRPPRTSVPVSVPAED